MPELIQESVSIGGLRRLAGELAYTRTQPRAVCLLANPHPYMGGRMDNNVIARLARALSAARIATLRFDYAGVGSSEGQPIDVAASMASFWQTGHTPVDALMIEDARAGLHWLREQCEAPLFIVGYSFGAYVAIRIAPPDCAGLVLISPTIRHHDFNERGASGIPTLVISGDNDFATDDATLAHWVDHLPQPRRGVRIAGGQHFFRGLEDAVARETIAFCDEILSQRSVPA